VKQEMPDTPRTLEEVKALKRKFERMGNIGVALFLPAVVASVVAAPILCFTVPIDNLPRLLRPLWHPIPLIVLFLLGYWVLIRISPLGRKVAPQVPMSRAINAFFLAEANYKQWEETGKRKYLVKSQQFLGLCRDYLNEVPEYQDLKKSINVAMAASN